MREGDRTELGMECVIVFICMFIEYYLKLSFQLLQL